MKCAASWKFVGNIGVKTFQRQGFFRHFYAEKLHLIIKLSFFKAAQNPNSINKKYSQSAPDHWKDKNVISLVTFMSPKN